MSFTILLLNSCGSAKMTQSENLSDGTKIEKAYIYVHGGSTDTGGTFSKVIKELFNSYNIVNYTYLYRDLDLKTDEEIKQDAKKFNATHMVYAKLMKTRSFYDGKGGSSEEYLYLISVSNINTEKTIWYANLYFKVNGSFQSSEPYIKKGLTEVFSKMKSDGIIK